MAVLPLFPLGDALMPGAFLPLQIFEERYVALLKDLVREQENRPPVFGVIAIRKGFEVGEDRARALHTVGCSAQLRQATSLGEERFLIVIEGRTRFRVDSMLDNPGTAYSQGEITWLEEVTGDDRETDVLAQHLRHEVAAYRSRLGDEALEAPEEARELSYWLAQAVDLDVSDRQLLLTSDSTEMRLRLGRQIVRRESTLNSSLGTTTSPSSFGGPISPN